MKISIYTFIKDGIYFDFHMVDMLKHHLALADEIIVSEGYSSDDTYEKIKNIDPKIKVFRNKWDTSDPAKWSRRFKDHARKKCTGDWCILLDADEFIPEWEFKEIRNYLEITKDVIIPIVYTHFYGNYKVYVKNPGKFGWPVRKMQIHRNLNNIEVWGDGSNVRLKDSTNKKISSNKFFEGHHFGFVRNPSRLRHKWHIQHKRNLCKFGQKSEWDQTPAEFFDENPYDWNDPDFINDLNIYKGHYVRAVRENPDEFVRDDFYLFNKLSK